MVDPSANTPATLDTHSLHHDGGLQPPQQYSHLEIIHSGNHLPRVEGLDGKKYLAAERLSGMNTIARVDKVQLSRSADGIHHLYGRPHG